MAERPPEEEKAETPKSRYINKAEAPETIDMSGALYKISKALLLRSETDLHEREGSVR